MIDALRGVMSSVRSLNHTVNMVWTRNTGGRVSRWRRSAKWRYIGKTKVRKMKKLDESKVKRIIREKRKPNPKPNRVIAQEAGVSVRWVQKLTQRYRGIPLKNITYPAPMGRPRNDPLGRREHAAILSTRADHCSGAVYLEMQIEQTLGIHIPHNTIHQILKSAGIAKTQPKKSRRRTWIRYEREHSMSLLHMDYMQMPDGRWFISCLDDASRFVLAYRVFENATTENALVVLDEAIKKYGKPIAVLTDRGTQFYANESKGKKRGMSKFEEQLADLGIEHILCGVNHPQTNGKIERLHGEIKRKICYFEESSYDYTVRGGVKSTHIGNPFNTTPKTDPIDRFMDWYNYERAHMSLDWKNQETPAQAFIRKMPRKEEIVVDAHTGKEYRVE